MEKQILELVKHAVDDWTDGNDESDIAGHAVSIDYDHFRASGELRLLLWANGLFNGTPIPYEITVKKVP